MMSGHRSILAKVAICALLVAKTDLAKAQQTVGVTKSQARWIVVGIAASGAAIGVGVYYVVRHNRSLTGCVVSGADGLQLQSQGDQQTYSLVGDVAEIKPGTRIRVSGKKEKKVAGTPQQFLVEKLGKDIGSCNAQPAMR